MDNQGVSGCSWDDVYRREDFVFGEYPNRFLAAEHWRLRPGMRALAIGDGEGRNGVWLAEQGLDVVSLDLSAIGLTKARRLAAERGVRISTLQGDLRHVELDEMAYDLVASIFVHFEPGDRHHIHRRLCAALRPGGLLVLVAFSPGQESLATGGPCRSELYYTQEELQRDLQGLDVQHIEDGPCILDEGMAHRGKAQVLRLVARRARPTACAEAPC